MNKLTFSKRCIQLLKTYKWKLLIAGAIGILFSILNSTIAFLIGSFLHKITQPLKQNMHAGNLETVQKLINIHFEFNTLTAITIAILTILIFKNICFVIYQFIFQYLRAKIITEFRKELFMNLIDQDFHYYDKKNSGSSFAIVMDDIQIVNIMFESIARNLILSVLISIALILSLFFISIKLSIITLLGTCIVSLIINQISKYLKKKAASIRKVYSLMLGSLQEMFLGIQVIKGFNKEKLFINKFNNILSSYFNVEIKKAIAKISTTPIQEIITLPFILFVLIIGDRHVKNGSLSSESLMQFFSVLLLLASPVKAIITEWIKINETIPSFKRVQEMYDQKSTVHSGTKIIEAIDEIDIKNLSFSYDSSINVLKNISFTIKKNECLGIIGSSGSGKSTLTHLLLRFYESPNESIFCNKLPIQNYKLNSWRDMFAYVPQQPFLFKDSIKNNLLLGKENATIEELIHVCKQANVWDFIKTLDKTLDHQLGENGAGLSGGQKQRIALARALLKKPNILILDEATSQLDEQTDLEIQKAIIEIKNKLTLIIISHKETHMKLTDKVLRLKDGKIVQEGSYKDVCKIN